MQCQPDANNYANLYAWFSIVSKFSESVRAKWPAAPKEEKVEKKAAAKADDDDDLDLFGSGSEDEVSD
jgi:hypothetical protein